MTIFRTRYCMIIILMTGLLSAFSGYAQKVDTISTLTVTGYVDAYYAYYTDSVGPGNFQKFPNTSPRSNSPGFNTAQLAMQYSTEKIRGVAAFHFGDVAAATWAPAPYTYIQEAHVGVKIFSKMWVDAGFFRTHFGTELVLPSENITSSVAVGTFYEPYYQSGIRLNFIPTSKLEINLFLLNGYSLYLDNNNKKSFGMAVNYAVNDNIGLGYTNYLGDDTPEGTTTKHLRFHENLFFNYSRNKIKLQAGGDFCLQQNSDLATGTKTATMFSALATFRYQAVKKLGIYVRGEIFQDPDGYMSTTIRDVAGNYTGYKLWGATAGVEFKPTDGAYIKLEGRRLQMQQDQYIYTYNSAPQNNRYEMMINAGVTFELLKKMRTRVNGNSQQPGSDADED